MSTWGDVSKGDTVVLRGRPYRVEKIKASGKRARVTVTANGGAFTSDVRLKDDVEIRPLRDERGAQTRWAKKHEVDAEIGPVPKGDPEATSPPRKPSADSWESRRDRVERRLEEVLGAHLVGEATGESVGYYVPPVDVTTVAAHWMIFHHGDEWVEAAPADLLSMHWVEHLAVEAGGDDGKGLKVNHWHTETRPEATK